MTPKIFVKQLSQLHFKDVFNPYSDVCVEFDMPDAHIRRQQNLISILESVMDSNTRTMWIARDLGYRGGRRTGLALTDEVHLEHFSSLFNNIDVEKVTRGPAVRERTASVIWKMLAEIGQPVLMWNVFPFHPHEPENPFSNRCHNRKERDQVRPIFESLVKMVVPEQLVSIGQDAKKMLGDINIPMSAVRHPSYGGQREFEEGIRDIYALQTPKDQNPHGGIQPSLGFA